MNYIEGFSYIYLYIYLKFRVTERVGEQIFHLLICSLLLYQAKIRSQECLSVSHMGGIQTLRTSSAAFLGALAESWISSRAAGTRTGARMRDQHSSGVSLAVSQLQPLKRYIKISRLEPVISCSIQKEKSFSKKKEKQARKKLSVMEKVFDLFKVKIGHTFGTGSNCQLWLWIYRYGNKGN